MNSNYKQDERKSKSIIETNLSPVDEIKNIQTLIYYKNRKVGNLFLKNNPHKKTVSHVVYQYTCAMEGCQPDQSYIGYTTTSVKQRMTTHAQNGAIKNHNLNEHTSRISANDIINQIKILFSATDKIDLQITEALLIKKHNPPLNKQSDTFTRTLQVFQLRPDFFRIVCVSTWSF